MELRVAASSILERRSSTWPRRLGDRHTHERQTGAPNTEERLREGKVSPGAIPQPAIAVCIGCRPPSTQPYGRRSLPDAKEGRAVEEARQVTAIGAEPGIGLLAQSPDRATVRHSACGDSDGAPGARSLLIIIFRISSMRSKPSGDMVSSNARNCFVLASAFSVVSPSSWRF